MRAEEFHRLERRYASLERDHLDCRAALTLMRHEKEELQTQYRNLRAQLVNVRVCQSTLSRAGWEVMCFIPEEVLSAYRGHPDVNLDDLPEFRWLLKRVTMELVDLALKGVIRVHREGTVCALVFEPLNTREAPRAPRYVQALYDREGTFKLSEKAWDQRTEEQRVRNAAGCN